MKPRLWHNHCHSVTVANVDMLSGCCKVWGLCALLAGLVACSYPYGPNDLVGTWAGASKEMSSVVMTFTPDGKWRFEYVDQQRKTHSLAGDYEANFAKAPVPLSIRNIPQLPHPLHTLIQFRGPDSLRMGSFASRWRLRPISFNPATQVLLKRRPEQAGKDAVSRCVIQRFG